MARLIVPRSLAELQNYPTCYEVVLRFNGTEIRRLAFVAKKTKAELARLAQQAGDEICNMLTDAELDAPYSYCKGTLAFGRVAVAFSGRTERDCALALIPSPL